MKRQVEAEFLADILDNLRRRASPGDLARRIGRHDEQQEEGDQRHPDQNGDGLNQPAEQIGDHQYRPFCVGSRISRSASPTRLKPSASMMIARPGKNTSHGAVVK